MKRRFAAALVSIAWLASMAPGAAAELQGPMERYRNLAGTWACESTLTMPNGQSQRLRMNMAFDIVDGNALRDRLSADGFDATLYYGYDPANKRYWAITANSDGTQLQQTSTDGLFYSGAVTQRPKVHITDLFAFQSDSRFTIHDVTTTPKGAFVTDSICTRT